MDEIVGTAGRTYGIPAAHVLDKDLVEAYWLAVFLMCRAANLSLQEAAELAQVSPARISQIQTKIERGKTSAKIAQVLTHYKLN